MDSMKTIKEKMACKKCNQESTVEVNVFEKDDLENSIEPITNQVLSPENSIGDIIHCPSCGGINAWDRKNQRFV